MYKMTSYTKKLGQACFKAKYKRKSSWEQQIHNLIRAAIEQD